MMVFNELSSNSVTKSPVVFAFGTFDGVHLGHQKIIQRVTTLAREKEAISAILTFSNHPISVLNPDKKVLYLSSSEQKVELIKQLGVDIVINIPFTMAFAHLTASQFIHSVKNMLPIISWVAGEDVHFGRNKEGNLDYLKTQSYKLGFEVESMQKFLIDKIPVSSSRIRKSILAGDLATARELLGRPLSFLCKTKGEVKKTESCNRIFCDVTNFCLPPKGIYDGEVQGQKSVYKAIFYVGSSLNGEDSSLEVCSHNLPLDYVHDFLEVRFLGLSN